MKKEPELFKDSVPYVSAYYYQDNLKVFEMMSEIEEISRSTPPHFHDEIEMLFLAEGSAILSVNGVEFPMESGAMAWLYPFHVHSLRPTGKGKVKSYICRYSLGTLIYLKINKDRTNMSLSILEYAPPCMHMGDDSQQIHAMFEEIISENKSRRQDYEMILLACLLRLITMFERKAETYIENTQSSARTLAWNALQYLQCYFNKEIDSAAVAAKFNISAGELNSALRLLTGKNFSQNLHEARIRNACAIMQFGDLSIPYIARTVGYTSQATFYRQFKAIKGKTPDNYRSNAAGEGFQGKRFISDSADLILNYVIENYQNPITVATTAAALYMSEATLAGTVEKNFHCTFSQMVMIFRLWLSAGLLLSTGMPACDIAVAAGFNSVRTFNRCFFKEFGTSPKLFRESGSRDKN